MTPWEGSEGQALEDESDHGAAEHYAEQRGQEMLDLYSKAKSTKVGQVMSCPGCGKGTVKTTYNKVFCSNGRNTKGRSSCKDYYWNVINPRGLDKPEDY